MLKYLRGNKKPRTDSLQQKHPITVSLSEPCTCGTENTWAQRLRGAFTFAHRWQQLLRTRPLHQQPQPEPMTAPCPHVVYIKILIHMSQKKLTPGDIFLCLWWHNLADQSGIRCGLFLLEPICSKVQPAVMLVCIPWAFVAFLSAWPSLAVLLWPLVSSRHFWPENWQSPGLFPFWVIPCRDGWVRNQQPSHI